MTETNSFHTVIVSDIHLGYLGSQAKILHKTLRRLRFRRLILAGDTFEHCKFHKYNQDELKFLSWLHRLSKRCEVIILPGNHDEHLPEIHGAKVMDEYAWDYYGKRYLVLHGHCFDDYLSQHKGWMLIFVWIDPLVRWIDWLAWRLFNLPLQYLTQKIKKHPWWITEVKKLADRAVAYGQAKGANYVFCGHVHELSALVCGNTTYLNTGSWVDLDHCFVGINPDGPKLYIFDETGQPLGCYSCTPV